MAEDGCSCIVPRGFGSQTLSHFQPPPALVHAGCPPRSTHLQLREEDQQVPASLLVVHAQDDLCRQLAWVCACCQDGGGAGGALKGVCGAAIPLRQLVQVGQVAAEDAGGAGGGLVVHVGVQAVQSQAQAGHLGQAKAHHQRGAAGQGVGGGAARHRAPRQAAGRR